MSAPPQGMAVFEGDSKRGNIAVSFKVMPEVKVVRSQANVPSTVSQLINDGQDVIESNKCIPKRSDKVFTIFYSNMSSLSKHAPDFIFHIPLTCVC